VEFGSVSEVHHTGEKIGDSDVKATVVWGLYVASLLFGLTAIVGLILAYIWRTETAYSNIYRKHFDEQIGLFWRTLAITLVAFVAYLIILIASGVTLRQSFGFEASFGIATVIYVIVNIVIFIYFIVISIVGFIKAVSKRAY